MAKFAPDVKSPMPDAPDSYADHRKRTMDAGLSPVPSTTGRQVYSTAPSNPIGASGPGGSGGGPMNPLWGNSPMGNPYDFSLKDPAARKAARK